MRTSLRVGSAVVCASLLCAVAFRAGAKEAGEAELPKVAEAAFRAAFPQAVVREVSEETEDGVKCFEVEAMLNGKRLDVEVSADGVIGEVECSLQVEELPAAVRAAVREATKGQRLTRVEKHEIRGVVKAGKLVTVDKPETLFEVKSTLGEKRSVRQFRVGPTGAVTVKDLSVRDDDDGDRDDAENDD